MQSGTFDWTPGAGWSEPPGALDSDNTIVVAFADAGLRDRARPLAELFEAHPRSHVVGCSTSGQFRDATLSDESLVVGVGPTAVWKPTAVTLYEANNCLHSGCALA